MYIHLHHMLFLTVDVDIFLFIDLYIYLFIAFWVCTLYESTVLCQFET